VLNPRAEMFSSEDKPSVTLKNTLHTERALITVSNEVILSRRAATLIIIVYTTILVMHLKNPELDTV
jgi:hypothetical protein